MADPAHSQPYRPIGEEPSGASSLFRHVLPLLVVSLIGVAFLRPDWLRGRLPAGVDPAALGMVAFGALFVWAVASGIRQGARRTATRRAAFDAFAASTGGRATRRPVRATSSGWEGGDTVAYTLDGWTAALSRDGARADSPYRLVVEVGLKRDFQFHVLPGGKAMRFVLSKTFLLPAFSLAVKSADRPGEAGETHPAALIERVRYMAGEPVATGDPEFDRAFILKASDAGIGRSFASDPGLRSALTALAGRTRMLQVGLESETPEGPGRLIVRATAEAEAALFGAMDAVARAALGALARADVVTGGARGAA